MNNDKDTLISAIEQLRAYHKSHPGCFTRSDSNNLEALEGYTRQLLGAAYRGQLTDTHHHHAFDRAHALRKNLERKCNDHQRQKEWQREYLRREEEKFNPYHKPAGSSDGGQFDFAPGGGESGGSPSSGSSRTPSNSEEYGRYRVPKPKNPLLHDVVDKHPATHTPPLPKYPSGNAPIKESDWQKYHDNLPKGPKISKTEQDVHAKIFAMEGGYRSDGKTYAGITSGALNDAKNRAALKDKLKDIHTPSDLEKRPELVQHIYKDHIDHGLRRTGVSAPLDKVGSAHAAAAMADTVFREGEGAGGNIIKNAVLRTDPKLKDILSDEHGILKEKTFEAYSKLAKNPATLGPLLDNVAEVRKQYSKNVRGKTEAPRADYFRFEKEREK